MAKTRCRVKDGFYKPAMRPRASDKVLARATRVRWARRPVASPTLALWFTKPAATQRAAVLEPTGGARGKARGSALLAATPGLVRWLLFRMPALCESAD